MLTPLKAYLRSVAVLAIALLGITCSGHDAVTAPKPQPVPEPELAISGPSKIIAEDSAQYTAALGSTQQSSVTWSSDNTLIATVTSAGYVKGIAEGNVVITATASGKTATLNLKVDPWVADSVVVTPASFMQLFEGDTTRLTAKVYDNGKERTDVPITWGTTDPSKVTVSESGLVTGVLRGSGLSIGAIAGGRVRAVNAAVYTLPVSISLRDSVVRTVPNASVSNYMMALLGSGNLEHWSGPVRNIVSSDTTIVKSLSPSGIELVARNTGSATVSAKVGALQASFRVNVLPVDTPLTLVFNWGDSLYIPEKDSNYTGEAHLRNAINHTISARASEIAYSIIDTNVIVRRANGKIVTRRAGRSGIIAQWRSLIDTLVVHVYRRGLEEIRIAPRDSMLLYPGDDSTRLVTLNGFSVPKDSSIFVDWTSANSSIATVDQTGKITGVAPGRTYVRVTSQLKKDSIIVRVRTNRRPTVTAVSPSILTPGGTATITGTNFRSTTDSQTVRIAGVAATITAASPTELTVQLASSGYACAPTQPARVEVIADGEAGAKIHTLQMASQISLQKGASVQLSASQLACNEFSGDNSARYIVSVINTDTSSTSNARLNVRGMGPITESQLPPSLTIMAPKPRTSLGVSSRYKLDPAKARMKEQHERMLKFNRDMIKRYGRPGPLGRQGANGLALAVNVPQTVGDTITLRYPNTSSSNACTQYTQLRARTVYNGQRVIIVEDIAAPIAGTMNSVYATLGAEFDNTMFNLVNNHFGNPFAAHTGASKIIMVFTHKVNADGPMAFVIGCDFYPRTQLASSNENPVFYARVPINSQTNYSFDSQSWWQHLIRSTIVHEVKHIAAIAERVSRGASVFEDTWLEEGTAMIAAELWARSLYGNVWKGDAKYAQTVRCELRPTDVACGSKPYAVTDHFGYLADFYASINEASPTRWWSDGLYGSGWSFARWAADHYATTEPTFFRALTQQRDVVGLANIAQATGRPQDELLTDWLMAAKMDGDARVTPANTKWNLPSWDVREIFTGLNASFPGILPGGSNPLKTYTFTFSGFGLNDLIVQGGTSAFFEVEMAYLSQNKGTLQFTPYGGTSIPSSLKAVVLRVN